jgi:hypothetical protein
MERVPQARLQSLNLVLGEAVEDLLNIRVGENCKRHLGKLFEVAEVGQWKFKATWLIQVDLVLM